MANPNELTDGEEEVDKHSAEFLGSKRTFDEFECPTCSAYNPHETFGNGDDVTCAYCGLPFTVEVNEDGKLKLREA